MTRFLLLRHGRAENPKNVFYGPSWPLAETGRRQIEGVASDLKKANLIPAHTYCSPFLRTHQTAEIVTSLLRTRPPVPEPRLHEWNVGPWFDKPLSQFYAATHYGENPPPDPLPPEIESLPAMGRRILGVLEELWRKHKEKTILVVSHREPLITALLLLQQQPLSRVHDVDFPVSRLWEVRLDEKGRFLSAEKRFDRS